MNVADTPAQRRGFLGSVLVVSSGTVAAQALGAAASPVLSRLYSPGDFGVLGLYIAVLSVAGTGATLRYESAIPLAETEAEAAEVFLLSTGLAAVNSALLLLLALALRPWLAANHDAAVLAPYALWIPLGVMGMALYRTLSVLAVRRHEFQALAATKITQIAAMIAIQIGAGVLHAGPLGLLTGHIAGQAGGSGRLMRRTLARPGCLRRTGLKRLRLLARKYARFPKFSTAAVLLNSCSEALPVICLTWMFGPVVSGWYVLVQRVLFLPGNAVVTSVSQVFFGQICKWQRESREGLIETSYSRRFKQLLSIGLAASAVMALAAPFAVPIVFGEKWREAGTCARILSPVFAAWLPVSSLATVLDALQRQDLHLLRELMRLALVGAGLGVARLCSLGWAGTMAFISAAFTADLIVYGCCSWLALKSARR